MKVILNADVKGQGKKGQIIFRGETLLFKTWRSIETAWYFAERKYNAIEKSVAKGHLFDGERHKKYRYLSRAGCCTQLNVQGCKTIECHSETDSSIDSR